ncbi:hypothetical protein E2C01_048656 [Portunus trituberculatus]|uniref:Uncharacterized protein n=1 Tax=Portunus trituberculatus TaxID=210409 RepID=A0A5B7G4D2_PORTR|nr:hypothetical protein [Portunus trituberculatus]
MVISRSPRDARELHGRLVMGDIIPLQDSISLEMDSRLFFSRHLENVARKTTQMRSYCFLRGTFLTKRAS